jgi:hypothetical protein
MATGKARHQQIHLLYGAIEMYLQLTVANIGQTILSIYTQEPGHAARFM